MIVCHKYKFLFIEIPKTASTSVGSCLNQLIGRDNLINVSETKENQSDLYKKCYRHCTIEDAYVDFPETRSYFRFTFVRNPWDLYVSHYLFKKQTLKEDLPPFNDWLKIQDFFHLLVNSRIYRKILI
jgi:hypothetical protein